ncbi:MAG: C45 family autoproteolytic acyltransferase/hydrolase [Thermoleophilia bacterium]|jgi:hypothetical protein|nr:C45 family autoproteolytic acyltransferase/hydrolase [Thermoleophilia bacterium]
MDRSSRITMLLALALLMLLATAAPALAADEVVVTAEGPGVWYQYGDGASGAIKANLKAFWGVAKRSGTSKAKLIAEARAAKADLDAAWVASIRSAAKGAGVRFVDLLAFNVARSHMVQTGACTNFAAAGTGTEGDYVIVSKNRDLQGTQVMFFVAPTSGYRYIGMMTAGEVGVSQGINEMGVAIGHNWMPVDDYSEDGLTPFAINEQVLMGCATADEAVAFIEATNHYEGATYELGDGVKAAIVETVPGYFAEQGVPTSVVNWVENGAEAHANHYMYEPYYSMVLAGELGNMWSSSIGRQDRADELLDENGHVMTPALQMAFNRDFEGWGMRNRVIELRRAHPEIPKDIWSYGWSGFSICNMRTVSSSVFVLSPESPELTSAMWSSINNPGFSPYTPFHTALLADVDAATAALPDYGDGTAWEAVSAVMKSHEYDYGDLLPTFVGWEALAFGETADLEAAARLTGDGSALADRDIGLALEAQDLIDSLLQP